MSEEGRLKFAAAEMNLVIHATEDESKVLKAIEDTLLVPSARFSRSSSEGHYKNKILLQKAILPSNEAALLAKRVISLLNSADREHLSRLVNDYADEKGNLYIRLDKQRICQGKVSLSETDALRIRFKPIRRFKPSDGVQNYMNLFHLNYLEWINERIPAALSTEEIFRFISHSCKIECWTKEAKPIDRIDLCVRGLEFDIASTLKELSISKVGIPFHGKLDEGAIYRLTMSPSHPVNYPYLVVSENIGEPADILTIRDFKKVKKGMNKKLKKGTGVEMIISPARKMDSISLAKWFSSLSDLYNFCHWSRCQFIISSGATSKYEMISGPCLDAILKTIGIEPQNYWGALAKWLDQRLARNVYYAKEAT